MRMASVGRSVPRKEGRSKATGAARYVDDLAFPGMIFGRTIRSPVPRGEIRRVSLDFVRRGFTVVDHQDIPGKNAVSLIEDDQPFLAEREVRHAEEPVLLLAHEDRDKLLEARVRVDVREKRPVLDPERSTRVFKKIRVEKGEARRALALAHRVIEGEYRTGHQEQLYVETNGVIAVPEKGGGVTVYGSLQCPYYVVKALKTLLALPEEKIRVVQVETGGGFGGKEEYPSMIAGHACLLALTSGRPVKIVYDRAEDMAATTKRHPSIVKHRTGVARDGSLVAMEIDVLMDGGAYVTLSPVVLSRGVLHAAGPYRCENVRIDGRAVMTHTPPNGAFRGFGAPQTIFAGEVQMDRVAEALELDPVEFRKRNAIGPGDTMATGQRLGPDACAAIVLKEAARRSGWTRKRRAFAGTHRGIGVALYYHGSGFTGGGEVKLASKASLELTPHGARVLVASTEIGQGTRTMHAQIVADALRIPYEAVEVADADTGIVPDSGPTVASRTCMVVGKILERCAREMRRKLGRLTPREYLKRHGPLVVTKAYEKPKDIAWDEETYRGDAYGAYAWACDVAEVEVDPATLAVRPVRITVVADVGKAIHPVQVRGQIEGGTAQGVGFALLEEVAMRGGRMANAELTNYLVPTTADTPAIDVTLLERPYRHGPFGAKGVGELPIDGPAPAIANALRHCGLDVREIPATPERLMALAQRPGGRGRGRTRRRSRGE